ncbi:hypothetical protein KUTeg_018359 [Tegillarca granosa]|uniref:Uncharacterized protein n=1 Tax=Tegillarca granosa TaxID=220873 RepID=A0ABQ9EHQ2_TEGGR|nr:hypothetical protein KUTeg_018359 [Tegillarca granosa]
MKSIKDPPLFCYLGSTLTVGGYIMKEVNIRIGKAYAAYNKLKNIWKSKVIATSTKLRLYKSNKYGETTKKLKNKLRRFEGRCLRRILNIRWSNTIRNKDLETRTSMNIITEVKRRRWCWIGHILRMKKTRYPHRALTWTPMS